MKILKLIALSIAAISMLASCSDDDDVINDNKLMDKSAKYVKYVTNTSDYQLKGRVRSVDIYTSAYGTIDNATNEIIKNNLQKSALYFDQNGALIKEVTFYNNAQYEDLYYIEYTYVYDSIYRIKEYIIQNVGPYSPTTIDKLTYEYDDITKTAIEITSNSMYTSTGSQETQKAVYQLNAEGRLDEYAEVETYYKRYNNLTRQANPIAETDYTHTANGNYRIETQKDSKGNTLEYYEIINYSEIVEKSLLITISDYKKQVITYYDSPASGEIVKEAEAYPFKTSNSATDYKLKGKVKSVTRRVYFELDAILMQINETTGEMEKEYPYVKYESHFNPEGWLTQYKEYESIQLNGNEGFTSIPHVFDTYQLDAKFRIVVHEKEDYNNISNSAFPTIQKSKQVITYDEVNKRANVVYYTENGSEELIDKTETFNLFGNSSKAENQSLFDQPRSLNKEGDFADTPDFINKTTVKYDAQNNIVLEYMIQKELDEEGNLLNKGATKYIKTYITYY